MSTDIQEECKVATFWISEATRHSEDKAIEVILAFFARLYATTDDALRKVMLHVRCILCSLVCSHRRNCISNLLLYDNS